MNKEYGLRIWLSDMDGIVNSANPVGHMYFEGYHE